MSEKIMKRWISMKGLWKKRMAGDQRGAFIVFTALATWFLMMFVAFAVDFGNYYQHRAQLQNAADAAALAGVAKYADSEFVEFTSTATGKGRLVKIPTNVTEGAGETAATFSSDSYTFTKLNGVPSDVHSQAAAYVNNNYVQNHSNRSGVEMMDSMWNAVQASTSSTTSQETAEGTTQMTTTTTAPKQYCYRVDLEDTVTTFFARIFGVETIPVKVSAMAMLDGTKSTTIEELLVQISEKINKVAANYYWETIVKKSARIIDSKTGEEEWSVAGGSGNSNAAPPALGTDKNKYYVVYGGGASSFSNQPIKHLNKKLNKLILGYREPEDSNNICAEQIYYDGNPDDWNTTFFARWSADLGKNLNYTTTRIFNIENKDGVTFHGTQDIQTLFLNRDHINQRSGPFEKYTQINIEEITGKTKEPLYIRLESEPIPMSTNGTALMIAHGVTVNVKQKTNSAKPFVLVYDGPDPARDEKAAPWMLTKDVKIGDKQYYLGQTFLSKEAWIKCCGGDQTKWDLVVQSSITASGPIYVNIPSDCVLYGGIFAPYSRVYINNPDIWEEGKSSSLGGGKIQGFIIAREIVVGDGSYEIGEQEVEMPVLVAENTGGDYEQFTYTRKYIKATYRIAYNKLDTSFMKLD